MSQSSGGKVGAVRASSVINPRGTTGAKRDRRHQNENKTEVCLTTRPEKYNKTTGRNLNFSSKMHNTIRIKLFKESGGI